MRRTARRAGSRETAHTAVARSPELAILLDLDRRSPPITALAAKRRSEYRLGPFGPAFRWRPAKPASREAATEDAGQPPDTGCRLRCPARRSTCCRARVAAPPSAWAAGSPWRQAGSDPCHPCSSAAPFAGIRRERRSAARRACRVRSPCHNGATAGQASRGSVRPARGTTGGCR